MKSQFRLLLLAGAFTLAAAMVPQLASAEGSCSTGACEVPNISKLEQSILENEKKGFWKAINWQPDAKSALQAARSQNKPLLVVLSVGQKGRADAPDT